MECAARFSPKPIGGVSQTQLGLLLKRPWILTSRGDLLLGVGAELRVEIWQVGRNRNIQGGSRAENEESCCDDNGEEKKPGERKEIPGGGRGGCRRFIRASAAGS